MNKQTVARIVAQTPAFDLHTHLFGPQFAGLSCTGLDELLTYHYLCAEVLSVADMTPAAFYALPKERQAELVFDELFVKRTPVSEACVGVMTACRALGVDTAVPDLAAWRAQYPVMDAAQTAECVMQLANISAVCMTNEPMDDEDFDQWGAAGQDARFLPVLRLDGLLNNWPRAVGVLERRGYRVQADLGGQTVAEVGRFLANCMVQLKPIYAAASLPDSFDYPADTVSARLFGERVLPMLLEYRLPLALMIGVRRGVNPALEQAGDGVARSDLTWVARLCADEPGLKVMLTVLSPQNQHDLCVLARKFPNIMPFGCWWFVNTPSQIAAITAMRLEMLGTGFVAQHSDCRVTEHLIYKWSHSRALIAEALWRRYEAAMQAGLRVTESMVQADAKRLLGGAAAEFGLNISF